MQCRAILDMPLLGVGVFQPEMILVESLVAIPPAMMVLPTTAAKIRHPTPPYSCLLVTTGHVGHGAPSTRCLPFTTGSMIRHREASACLPVPSSQRHASLSPRAKRSDREASACLPVPSSQRHASLSPRAKRSDPEPPTSVNSSPSKNGNFSGSNDLVCTTFQNSIIYTNLKTKW